MSFFSPSLTTTLTISFLFAFRVSWGEYNSTPFWDIFIILTIICYTYIILNKNIISLFPLSSVVPAHQNDD